MQRVARPLMYVGIVAIVLAMSKLHASVVASTTYDFTGSFRFAWALAYCALLGLTAYGTGLPDVPRSARGTVLAAVGASALGAFGISLIQLVVGDALLPRFVVLGSALLMVPWYLFCAVIATGGRVRAEERDRAVLVGALAEAETLADDLAVSAERPAVIVGSVRPEQARRTEDGVEPLVDLIRAERATLVVLDREAQGDPSVVAQVAELHEEGVRVRTLSLFYEEWLGKLPLSELERVSLMFDIGELHRVLYGRVKRVLDIAFGLAGCLALLLVMPIVLIGDLIGNRGRVFFHQSRVGKNGGSFNIHKFRTMKDTELDVGQWTDRDDPRITPFGHFLRRSHLDELPQAINILRGDLSVVGPRPEQPHYVAELTEKLPFYELRHLVRPGLTGWAQVKYHYGADEHDAMEKLQYEFYYLRHQRLSVDLRIIGRTVRSVIGRAGR